MELRRLQYFLRVAANGSLGKASRATGIAQPALGRQIQLMEAELGVKLFQRVPRGMELTDEGEYLRDALELPLQQVDMALRNVRSYSSRVEATLRLGLPDTLLQAIGPAILQRLQEDLPNLKLSVIEGAAERLAGDISRGLIDIALLVDALPEARAFHSEMLTEALMLVGRPGDPLLQGEAIAFGKLRDLPLILPGAQSSLRTRLNKTSANAELPLDARLEIDSTELTLRAAMAGAGYAVLPPIAFRPAQQRGELAGIAIAGLEQSVFWAVQPHWRVPRSTYNAVERTIYEVLYGAVMSGEWPARWTMDLARLSLPLRPEQLHA